MEKRAVGRPTVITSELTKKIFNLKNENINPDKREGKLPKHRTVDSIAAGLGVSKSTVEKVLYSKTAKQ